jgi:hypothetical protein
MVGYGLLLASWYHVILCGLCVHCDPLCIFVDHTLWYTLIQLNCVVSACNFNLVNRMLTIWESSLGAILLSTLLQLYPCYYTLHIIYSCTCWVPTISVLTLAHLVLRRWIRLWSTSIWCSRQAFAIGRLPVDLWCLSAAMLPRVFD